jgi:hypothetical protein
MADILLKVDENVIPNLAQAIKLKTGKNEPLMLSQFQEEVETISGGSSAMIDETLTISGAAADAKVVGDTLGLLESLETNTKSNLVSAINEVARYGSPIKNTPRTIIEFNGELTDMNTNEENPTTQYYGTPFENVQIEPGKYYYVEYNGTPYVLYGSVPSSILAELIPSETYIGNSMIFFEWIMSQNSDSGDSSAILVLLIILLLLGGDAGFDNSDCPFQLLSLVEGEDSGLLFLVNNGVAECNLKVTEFDISIEPPLNEYLQTDFLQIDKNNPGYIKNKIAGIEPSGLVFFDGVAGELTTTPITNTEGETTSVYAPLNDIGGMQVYSMTLKLSMGLVTNITTACIVVQYRGSNFVLSTPTGTDMSNMDESVADAFATQFTEAFGENAMPFGNLAALNENLPDTGEPFCVVVYTKEEEEPEGDSSTGDSSTGDSSTGDGTEGGEGTTEEGSGGLSDLDSIFDDLNLYATIFSTITEMPTTAKMHVELGWCMALDRKFLPFMEEYDLPATTLTYSRSSKNMMIEDSENGYEYIIISKNGVLETYCRCASIAITTNPTKTSYKAGEYFDPTGMKVTAICQDGTTKDVTDKVTCVFTTSAFTSTNTKEVTVTFNEAGHAYTAIVAVTVSE